MRKFKLQAPYAPAGDQPQAIQELSENIQDGKKEQILLFNTPLPRIVSCFSPLNAVASSL